MDIGNLLHNPNLPAPAPVVLKLYEVLDSGGAGEIADVIESDPTLSARLLRLANSAFYSRSPVASVRDAVLRVGTLDVAALLLSTEVVNLFKGIPEGQLTLRSFWEHSLQTACYSRVLCQGKPVGPKALLWVCGLLHDVGKLLLLRHVPADFVTVCAQVDAGTSVLEAEAQCWGINHAQVGVQLLRNWQLPEVIAACAAAHHEPYTSLDTPETIVAAANALANSGNEVEGLPGMTDTEFEQTLTEADQLYQRYWQLFAEYL